MKTAIATLAAAVALTAAAAPAAAQPYRGEGPRYEQGRWDDQNIDRQQARLERRIERGLSNGSLTRQEARQLRFEHRELVRLEAQYRRGGLTAWERADLDRKLDRLDRRIEAQRNDREYGYGYGRR